MFKRIINDFDLKNTFMNGQCFRFNPCGAGYLGVAMGKVIYLEKSQEGFIIDGVTENEFDEIFVKYLDLQRDYKAIAGGFVREENLLKAIEYGGGMRILAQPLWETLFSFIISQNNNIVRIKAIIERICAGYGTPVEYNGATYYLFPTAQQLKDATEEDYLRLGCGYRSKYLVKIVEDELLGRIDHQKLYSGYDAAKEELLSHLGVGPKVADCILLFGLNYLDAFPVDTWIKKVMESLFLKKSATKAEISDYAKIAFGEYAGIAQQYLFYYARENKIKGID